jgi:hypothetical protein
MLCALQNSGEMLSFLQKKEIMQLQIWQVTGNCKKIYSGMIHYGMSEIC